MDCSSVPPPNPSAMEVALAQSQSSDASHHRPEPSNSALLRDPRKNRMSDVAAAAAVEGVVVVVAVAAVVVVAALM